MSKCIVTSNTEAAREHQGGALEAGPSLSFSSPEQQQRQRQAIDAKDSPLLKALRSHFERYQGLTEPRIESLRPQTDDL